MAEFYECKTGNDKITLGCYSERGIMAYYFFNFLPKQDTNYLINKLNDKNQKKFPIGEIKNLIIFSELDLGNQGFGSPDGALYFEINEKSYFIFIEAKFNETYSESCSKKSYNSTLKGQLELKYRFAKSFFKIMKESSKEEIKRIEEDEELTNKYKEYDSYYKSESYDKTKKNRRLSLKEGIYDFCKILKNCKYLDNIYYLGITKDEKNPFMTKNETFPEGISKNNLLWLPVKAITDDLEKVPFPKCDAGERSFP